MKTILGIILFFLSCSSAVYSGEYKMNQWARDFSFQRLSKRPKLEARYTDASRKAAIVEAENYKLKIDLQSGNGQKVSEFVVDGRNVLASNGLYLQAVDKSDKEYSSLKSRKPSRINIYRRGPYYIEVHWLDVLLRNGMDELPIKGEVVLHCYPEKVHLTTILHVTENVELASAALVLESNDTGNSTAAKLGKRLDYETGFRALLGGGKLAAAYVYPARFKSIFIRQTPDSLVLSNFIASEKVALWKTGEKHSGHMLLYPMVGKNAAKELDAELNPLPPSSITAQKGEALGYDPVKGCYTVRTDNPGDFNYHYYKDQNHYETAAFSIDNDSLFRKIYICHETGEHPGSVECGVVLDENGDILPITVQISKNFAGEKEEPFYNPTDIPFSETFFPLYLAPKETRELTSLHLYQNWGNHPLKQFSSLGAWMDYYHMSTGVTETTCYVPFLFAGLSGVSIADFRPMSQEMWDSQPQHDNVAGHSFLRYKEGDTWHYVEYTGTAFRSTGPNWADMSMHYSSDDGRAKVTCDVFELPQTDELRNFIRMRIDILGDIKVSDMAQDFRVLNIATWVQRLRFKTLAYTGDGGIVIEKPINLDNSFTVSGAVLGGEFPFACVYPYNWGNNSFIIRGFEGKLGGKPVKPAVSLWGEKEGDTILMLVPGTDVKEARKGDYLEIDLFLMPYGDEKNTWKEPAKARMDYGENAPRVTQVIKGRKISDFPTRIECGRGETAEFSVDGGYNYILITVSGFSDYRGIRLYEIVDGKEILVDHEKLGKDGYQVFVTEDGRFGSTFLFNTDGREHKFITRR